MEEEEEEEVVAPPVVSIRSILKEHLQVTSGGSTVGLFPVNE